MINFIKRYNTNLSSRCTHRCIYIKDNTIPRNPHPHNLMTLNLFLLGFTENIRHLTWRLVTVEQTHRLLSVICVTAIHTKCFNIRTCYSKTTVAIYRHLFDESLLFKAMSMLPIYVHFISHSVRFCLVLKKKSYYIIFN